MKIHLVLLQPKADAPNQIEARRQILKWPKARAVPCTGGDGRRARQLLAEGMACEIDDADLEEARELADVAILGTKELEE